MVRVSRGLRAVLAVVLAASLAPASPAEAGAPPPPPPPGGGPEVTAEPSTGLVDFQLIQVTGVGFEPASINEIFECRADAVDESGCDPDNAYFADADGEGVVRSSFPVDARIFDRTGRETDCRSAPDACKIGIGLLADFSVSAFATIGFDPEAPLHPAVAATVEPDDDLHDQQTVTVHGANLSSLFETFVYQCAADGIRSSSTCNFDQDVRAVAGEDGTVTVDYRVDASLVPAGGGDPIDCTAAPGACVVELSQGFSDRPDRFTRAPLAFHDAGPPTTSTTTSTPPVPSTTPTTASPPTTAPPPPPPPAHPITRPPTYTA